MALIVSLEWILSILAVLIAFSAAIAAVSGIIVLESFFKNKLKELFSDKNFFIFFFLVIGYFLYSIGEVASYLTLYVFDDFSSPNIADVYWVGGAFFILVAFVTLSFSLRREEKGVAGMIIPLILGGVLAIASFLIISILTGKEAHLFNYFYPLISSLIVAFAFSTVFLSTTGDFHKPLLIFFLASSAILFGDIVFAYFNFNQGHQVAELFLDIFYLLGYLLSFIAFIVMRLTMRNISMLKQR